MKKLNITAFCRAVYNSSIEVPDELTIEEAIKYAKNHIDEMPCNNLTYMAGSDTIDEENCDFE